MVKKHFSLTLFFFLAIHALSAQDWFSNFDMNDWLQGYVIGIAGDTINGSVRFDYPVAMQKHVLFYKKSGSPDQPVTYGPADVRGYGIEGKRWVSTQVMMETYDGAYQFSRFGIAETIPGPIVIVRIFEEADKKKKKLNSDQANRIVRGISYNHDPNSFRDLYIKKFEETAVPVFSREFKKSFQEKMLDYVNDHDELKDKIIDKSWGYNDLMKIANEYNRWYQMKKTR